MASAAAASSVAASSSLHLGNQRSSFGGLGGRNGSVAVASGLSLPRLNAASSQRGRRIIVAAAAGVSFALNHAFLISLGNCEKLEIREIRVEESATLLVC